MISESSFADWFDQHEAAKLRSKHLITGQYELRYDDLFARVRRLAAYFSDCGMETGASIAIISADDAAVTTLFIAAVRYGITAIVLDPGGTPVEHNRLIEFSCPDVVFADHNIADGLAPDANTVKSIRIVRVDQVRSGGVMGRLLRRSPGATSRPDSLSALLDRYEPVSALPKFPDPDTTAYILFTSGTTSMPKGVEIAHRSLDKQLRVFLDHYALGRDAKILNLLPLHHTDGLTQGTILAFAAGASIVRPFRFSIQKIPELLDSVYHHRISHYITVPSVLTLIREFGAEYRDAFETDDFQFIVSTAAYLDESLWSAFERDFNTRVVNVYGLTETVSEAFYCGPDAGTRKIGTIGKPVGCEARIEDESGNSVSTGEAGELLIRGDIVMKGYFRLPDETASVLRDGWLRTGDIATCDADGFFRIVGRKKNMIIVGGINVYPEDVRGVLIEMPGVQDAVVFGETNEHWGEVPIACIEVSEGFELSQSDVQEFFLAQASREKLPREIHFVDRLPRGPAGKVVLSDVRDLIRRDDVEEVSGENLAERVLRIAARAFKVDAAVLDVHALAEDVKEWDSLTHVEFLFSLEKEFNVRLSPQEIFNIRTISDGIEIINSKSSGRS